MNRRVVIRVVAVAAAVLIVVVATALLALSTIARWVTVWQLGAATGRQVTLDALDVALIKGRIGLRGLRVIDRDGGPLLTVERVDARFSPRALVRGHLRIVDATVQAVAVHLVRTGPNAFNVSDLLVRRAKERTTTAAVTIERFTLAGGAIAIEDRTLKPARTWRVDGMELKLRDASTVAGTPPGVATLNAVVAGAPVALSVTDLRLAPLHFRATLDAREIDASLAALYLPPASPLSPERGKVGVSATVDHDAATGSLIALDAGFTGVELHRPGQASAYLSAPSVRVKVEGLRVRPGGVELTRLAVDGGAIALEDTRLQPVRRWRAEGLALEARNLSSAREAPPGVATARASMVGARLEVWVANVRLAPLELHATAIVRNVDLALVRLYLPPELPVRPERGVVNATLRVEHDGRRGTRLGLDAGLSGIELRRPAHFVMAPSVRVTVDDIALDRGAVSVGRVNVAGDRLTIEERTAKAVRTWPIRNLVFEAKDLSSRREAIQGVASLRASVAGAAASVFVTGARLQPLEFRATVILRDVDAAFARLYLPPEVPVQLERGVVNATFQLDHVVADGTKLTGDVTLTGLEARGRGPFATSAVTAPSVRLAIADGRRHGSALSIGRVELSGGGSLTDSRAAATRVDFAQLRIALESLTWPVSAPARVEMSMRFQDRGELDGSGTAQLTALTPAIAWVAELGLKFRRVDLTPLAAYVPAAAGLGGRVGADVTMNLAYAGSLTARVRGDVGGARFALADRGRTLLSLRSVDATGLDVQWPERMSIKRLRLREPYALVERDRQARFPILTRFAAPPTTAAAPPPETPSGSSAGAARRARPSIALEEVVVEHGTAAIVDETGDAPVRLDLPRVDLTARNVTWPASGPAQVLLDAALPAGGTLRVDGSVSAEPIGVDVTLALKDADLAWFQPFLGFRARVGGRLDANLKVAGPLAPAPRLKVSGDAGLRSLDISDGQRSVLKTDHLRVTGIDAQWPERVAIDRVRTRQSWALIERDRQGRFLLRTLLERRAPPGPPRPVPPATSAPAPAAPTAPALEFSFREGVFEDQAATIVDAITTPPARVAVAGARLAVRDFSWPSRSPAKVELTSPMPAGGRLDVTGTVQLVPMRLEARATLDAVAIEPVQPYLPIDGNVAGKVTGDLTVKLALDPTAVQVAGQARLQGFRLSDGDRAVVTVGRVETAGIDVDWPKRITLRSVQLRRPRLLIERDLTGEIRLRRLVTPRWATTAPDGSPPVGSRAGASGSTTAASVPAATMTTGSAPTRPTRPPEIEVATFTLDRASARFVDQTTTPAYAEELEELTVSFTPFSTAPGRRMRFSADGVFGGGALKLRGEGAYGERPVLDMKLDLRDYVVPRANAYVDRHTAWTASNGSLDVTGSYKLDGSQLDTRHDLLVRGLEVVASDERDEVERRIGLPFGMLVSLLKDARGEIRLSLPVSGDVSTREFEYQEALWSAVKSVSIRLLALPFSKIGSLFFSEDSKFKAVALAPAVFEPGTERLGSAMGPHLERVADFLRGAPSMKVILEPILTTADVQMLKRARVLAHLASPAGTPGGADPLERARGEYRVRWPDKPMPPTLEAIVAELGTVETLAADALRTLATRRLEAVRQAVTRGGGVDAARLGGTAQRSPLVEAAGQPRVEFDLRP